MILEEKRIERGSDREHTALRISLFFCLFVFLFRLFTNSQKSQVIEQTFTVFIGLTNLSIILR